MRAAFWPLLTAGLLLASCGEDEPKPVAGEHCPAYCQAHEAADCPDRVPFNECVMNCTANGEDPPECTADHNALIECFSQAPMSCDDDGQTVIDHNCPTLSMRLSKCLQLYYEPISCGIDADCEAPSTCYQGACQTFGCDDQDDCDPFSAGVCKDGICRPCAPDNCSGVCFDNECFECIENTDCDPMQECDDAHCVDRCDTEADCEVSAPCDSGLCGVPVGTLAIGKAGATNAGLLAISILSNSRPELRSRLRTFRVEQTERVRGESLP